MLNTLQNQNIHDIMKLIQHYVIKSSYESEFHIFLLKNNSSDEINIYKN